MICLEKTLQVSGGCISSGQTPINLVQELFEEKIEKEDTRAVWVLSSQLVLDALEMISIIAVRTNFQPSRI